MNETKKDLLKMILSTIKTNIEQKIQGETPYEEYSDIRQDISLILNNFEETWNEIKLDDSETSTLKDYDIPNLLINGIMFMPNTDVAALKRDNNCD